MIPIRINTSELQAEFNLTSKDVSDLKEEILIKVTNECERVWRNVVINSSLKSSRKAYLQGIKIFREGQFKGGVMLIGKLPNMIENGCSAFDMKEGMLNSKKIKTSKTGAKYITIGLRIATPTATAESQAFAGKMPESVYKIAKGLQGKQQIKEIQLPQEVRENKGIRPFVKNESKEFQEYQHKTSIFAGLQKGQGSHHGEYGTFRRISNNPDTGSDPNSWIHKGIQAYKLADKVENLMQQDNGESSLIVITDKVIERFLNEKI